MLTFKSSSGPLVTPKPSVQLSVFVENAKLLWTFNRDAIYTEILAKTVRILHRSGVTNTNENLTGLATLARNEASVRLTNTFDIVPSPLGPVAVTTVNVVVGRLNTTIGKNLATQVFVDGLLVKKWVTLLPIFLNLLNRN